MRHAWMKPPGKDTPKRVCGDRLIQAMRDQGWIETNQPERKRPRCPKGQVYTPRTTMDGW